MSFPVRVERNSVHGEQVGVRRCPSRRGQLSVFGLGQHLLDDRIGDLRVDVAIEIGGRRGPRQRASTALVSSEMTIRTLGLLFMAVSFSCAHTG